MKILVTLDVQLNLLGQLLSCVFVPNYKGIFILSKEQVPDSIRIASQNFSQNKPRQIVQHRKGLLGC